MAYDKNKFLADPRVCVLPKGAAFGDRRFRYKNYWCLSPGEKEQVARRYPYKVAKIPDSAYAYPIDKTGQLAKGRASRTLIWNRKHTMKKVHTVSGARRRR